MGGVTCSSRYLPIKPSGRCLYHPPSLLLPKKDPTATAFVELCGAHGSSQNSAAHLSLTANGYYQRRYAFARTQTAGPESSTSFFEGDLVVRPVLSTTPTPLRHHRMVDVTGVNTSYYAASETDHRMLSTVDEAVRSMHLHDGTEVPYLHRGDVPIGKLVVHCVCSDGGSSGRLKVSFSEQQMRRSCVVVHNAAAVLLGKRRMVFRSKEVALEMSQALANRCRDALPHLELHPMVKEGRIVGMRMVVV